MVVSLYVVGFCFMYNIHDVHLPISIHFFSGKNKMVINRVLDYSDVYFSCLFFESFAKLTVSLLKLIFFFILI
jgi:hypothetical protein